MSAASAGATAALIASQQRKLALEREEEETMTSYTNSDLTDNWEFKILRAGRPNFGSPETLQKALQEEAQSGWELVEKFDDYRIRLKRKKSSKVESAPGGLDPYRTNYNTLSENWIIPIFGLIVIFVVGIVMISSL